MHDNEPLPLTCFPDHHGGGLLDADSDHLTAALVHAVRNPLHGLLNCVELLESQLEPDALEASETLAMMREGLGHIDTITRRLLGAGRAPGTRHTRSLAEDLLTVVTRRMSSAACAREVELRLDEIDRELHLTVDADRALEALCNVVDNAISACVPGRSVIVRAERSRGEFPGVAIEVEDNGHGIHPEHLDRVLDPFFTTKPATEGFGLGLAITRRVVEAHGGNVEIESELGVGTTVRLVFPEDDRWNQCNC